MAVVEVAATGAADPPAGGAAPVRAAGESVAYAFAYDVARRGPRPAGGRRERDAQRRVAARFRVAGLHVSVQPFGVPGLGRSRNVIGAWEGGAPCLRVFMAHADSTPRTPGADDNASGLGALVDLAGRLERVAPPCDVWLVATGTEERLYTGQRDHLGALRLARRVLRLGLARRLRYALSLDEVGSRTSFWLRSPARRPRARPERELLRAARRVAVPVSWVRDPGTGNSDHREFELLGLPAAKLGVADNPCRHARCDRPTRLRDRALRRAVRLAVAVAAAP